MTARATSLIVLLLLALPASADDLPPRPPITFKLKPVGYWIKQLNRHASLVICGLTQSGHTGSSPGGIDRDGMERITKDVTEYCGLWI